MFGECHAHMIMDGVCFREAAAKHRNGPDEALIRQVLSAYQKRNVLFIRDGGDNLDVSRLAADLAPEYGIDSVSYTHLRGKARQHRHYSRTIQRIVIALRRCHGFSKR